MMSTCTKTVFQSAVTKEDNLLLQRKPAPNLSNCRKFSPLVRHITGQLTFDCTTLDLHFSVLGGAETCPDNENVSITQMYLFNASKMKQPSLTICSMRFTIYRIKKMCCSWSMASVSKELSDKARCLRASVATYLEFLAVRQARVVSFHLSAVRTHCSNKPKFG